MMYCMNCGQQLPDGAKFCHACGTATDAPLRGEPAGNAAPVQDPVFNKISSMAGELKKLGSSGNYKAAANQMRQILEVMVRFLLDRCGLQNTVDLKTGIDMLCRNGVITSTSCSNYHIIRQVGNRGSHPDGVVTEAMLMDAVQRLSDEAPAFRSYAAGDYSALRQRASENAGKGSSATPLMNLVIRMVGLIFASVGLFFVYNAITSFSKLHGHPILIVHIIVGSVFAILGLTLLIGGKKVPEKLSNEVTNYANRR